MIQPLKIQSKKKSLFLISVPILLAFTASLVYWLYLFFTTTMLIQWDSIGYQSLGTLIHEQGWISYFQTGPNREPIYPFIISISMGLGNFFSVSYHPIQKFIQLLFLFLTQILTLKILRKLKVGDTLTSLCILYLGFSPALVNSALSLYSEIVTYPIILTIILLSYKAWQSFQTSWEKPVVLGFLCGLAFIAITFVKGIFEIITPAYLMAYSFFTIKTLIKKNTKLFINSTVFLSTLLLTFYIPLTLYKSLNKKYNGNFALTNRGAWALYGNTTRRMEPFTTKKLFAALAYAPGEGVCKKIFDAESCKYWSFEKSDEFGYGKLHELKNQGIPNEQIDKILIALSLKKVLHNPIQYGLFAGLEGLKMIFWESTKIGFVDYPCWLTTLFNFTLFKDGIRFAMSLLTLAALLYLLKFVWSNRRYISADKKQPDEQTILLSCVFVLITSYIILHSFFFILTRYILPITPLYLITITFFLQRIISHNKQLFSVK